MTTEITIRGQARPAEDAVAWLTRSLPSLRASNDLRGQVAAILPEMTAPADRTWLLARVASMLNAYYEKATPQAVRMMEAEDWLAELGGYPQWAIEMAVRWWKSAGNPNRRKRPIEGDISARCRDEMDAVLAAERILAGPIAPPAPEPSNVRLATPEQRSAINDLVRKAFPTTRKQTKEERLQ